MATIPSKTHSTPQPSGNDPQTDKQLWRDRTVGALIIAGLLGLIVLMIWLASLGGSVPSDNFYDYWMP